MERGLGDFITRTDLEARDVIHNIRRLPNVQVQQCLNPTTRLRMSDCWDIKIARGVMGNVLTGGGRCPPLIYVDGHLLPRSDMGDDARGSASGADGGRVFGTNGFTLLQNLPRDALEGIEVYRSPAGAPAQYRTIGDACGIILVWTRGR